MSNVSTKKARVINYLSRKNRGLTVAEARSRFGVGNLRAMMSDIRRNSSSFNVVTEETSRGNFRYYIDRA
jgi:hypothetical protein